MPNAYSALIRTNGAPVEALVYEMAHHVVRAIMAMPTHGITGVELTMQAWFRGVNVRADRDREIIDVLVSPRCRYPRDRIQHAVLVALKESKVVDQAEEQTLLPNDIVWHIVDVPPCVDDNDFKHMTHPSLDAELNGRTAITAMCRAHALALLGVVEGVPGVEIAKRAHACLPVFQKWAMWGSEPLSGVADVNEMDRSRDLIGLCAPWSGTADLVEVGFHVNRNVELGAFKDMPFPWTMGGRTVDQTPAASLGRFPELEPPMSEKEFNEVFPPTPVWRSIAQGPLPADVLGDVRREDDRVRVASRGSACSQCQKIGLAHEVEVRNKGDHEDTALPWGSIKFHLCAGCLGRLMDDKYSQQHCPVTGDQIAVHVERSLSPAMMGCSHCMGIYMDALAVEPKVGTKAYRQERQRAIETVASDRRRDEHALWESDPLRRMRQAEKGLCTAFECNEKAEYVVFGPDGPEPADLCCWHHRREYDNMPELSRMPSVKAMLAAHDFAACEMAVAVTSLPSFLTSGMIKAIKATTRVPPMLNYSPEDRALIVREKLRAERYPTPNLEMPWMTWRRADSVMMSLLGHRTGSASMLEIQRRLTVSSVAAKRLDRVRAHVRWMCVPPNIEDEAPPAAWAEYPDMWRKVTKEILVMTSKAARVPFDGGHVRFMLDVDISECAESDPQVTEYRARLMEFHKAGLLLPTFAPVHHAVYPKLYDEPRIRVRSRKLPSVRAGREVVSLGEYMDMWKDIHAFTRA